MSPARPASGALPPDAHGATSVANTDSAGEHREYGQHRGEEADDAHTRRAGDGLEVESPMGHYARLALAQGTGEDVLAHTHGRGGRDGRFHIRLSLKHAYGIILLLLVLVAASWMWIFFAMKPSEPSRALGGSGTSADVDPSTPNTTVENAAAEAGGEGTVGGQIVVYISGNVARPGVYYLHDGDRIGDAIAQAGGLGENADDSAVNLAQRAEDGSHIHIPARGEAIPSTGGESESKNVNLNTATAEELQTLPGIGPHLADAIVQWREKNGQFHEPHDVTKVPGIGDSTFAKFEQQVTV